MKRNYSYCLLLFVSLRHSSRWSSSAFFPSVSNPKRSRPRYLEGGRRVLLPELVDSEQPPPKTVWSDFWGHTTQRQDSVLNQHSLPCIPSLDPHGELPEDAYSVMGSNVPLEFCRISLALDSEKRKSDDEFDIPAIVRSLQEYVDDGFQTFIVKSGPSQEHRVVEEEILGRFLTETPVFARERCTFVLPLRIPSEASGVMSPLFVRRQVAASLGRLGADAIDCIQLQHRETSPYFLEIMDMLEDLKREGLVRSVSARNLPPSLIRQAKACQFEIINQQLDVNLLDPTAYDTEHKLLCSDLGLSLTMGSPLAGGLLSDRYRERPLEPLSTQLSLSGNRHIKTTMKKWNARFARKAAQPWQRFQRDILPVLSDIALKHRVSVASVCLRWILQLEKVAGTVTSHNLFDMRGEDDKKIVQRIKDFRNVIRFELDEEDVDKLWKLSGVEPPRDMDFSWNEEDEDSQDFEMRNGLYLP